MHRITMKDIAEKLGVSTNTVSRAFNNKLDISIEMRKKILDTAQSMGYKYNKIDRSTYTNQNKIIGLTVADNSNPFFCKVVKGIEDTLRQSGFSLLLSNTDENYLLENNSIDVFVDRKVNGILLTPTQSDKNDILRLEDIGMPFVLVGRHFNDLKTDYIITDDRGGAFAAIDHLILLGHRDILFINAPNYISSAAERLEGYKEVFEKNGLEYNPDLIKVCTPKMDSASNIIKQVLSEGLKFTAVFTFSDLMMLGVFKVLKSKGFKLPEDVSLIGFDDIDFISLLEPSLTTIRTYKYQLGAESAKILMAKINGVKEIKQLVLPTELIVRNSTVKVK